MEKCLLLQICTLKRSCQVLLTASSVNFSATEAGKCSILKNFFIAIWMPACSTPRTNSGTSFWSFDSSVFASSFFLISATSFFSSSISFGVTFQSTSHTTPATASNALFTASPVQFFRILKVVIAMCPPRIQKNGFSAIALQSGSLTCSSNSARRTSLSFLLYFKPSSMNAMIWGWKHLVSAGATNQSITLRPHSFEAIVSISA